MSRRRFVLPDSSLREEPLEVEINWNEQVKGAKAYRFKWGEKEMIVKAEHIEGVFFALGREELQDRMLAIQSERKGHGEPVAIIEKDVIVKATRKVEAGEFIRTRIKINLPKEIRDYYDRR